MQIRITAAVFESGNIQFTRGQILDLPEELAQRFVDDGVAEAVPSAENAAMPRYATAVGFVPPASRIKPGKASRRP